MSSSWSSLRAPSCVVKSRSNALSVPVSPARRPPPRHLGKQRARELRANWGNPNLPIIDLSNEIHGQTSVWVVRARLRVEADGGIFGRGDARVMVINTRDRGLGKQRATAAHELGHYLEDEEGEFAELIDQNKPTEAFAEGFAIELLAPEDGVREWLRNQGLDRQDLRA